MTIDHVKLLKRALMSRAYILRSQGRAEDTLREIKRIFDYAEKLDNQEFLAAAYLLSSDMHLSTGRFKESIGDGLKGLKIATKHGYEETEALLISNLAIGHRNIGKYDKSLDYYHRVLGIWKKNKRLLEQSKTMSNIGIVFMMSGKMDDASKYFKDGLAIAKKIKDPESISYLSANLAVLNRQLHKFAESLKYFKSSNKMLKITGDKYLLMANYGNMAFLYLEQKEWSNARRYFNLSRKLAVENQSVQGQAKAVYGLGKVHLRKNNNYRSALKDFINSLELFKKCGDRHSIGILYKDLFDCCFNIGKLTEAIEHILGAIRIFNSLKRFNEIQKVIDKIERLPAAETEENSRNEIITAIRKELEKIEDLDMRKKLIAEIDSEQ